MMKTVLSILLVLVFTMPLWSQEPGSKPQFGLSISPQLVHVINNESFFESKASVGYSLQAFIMDDISQRLQIYGGLVFQNSRIRQRDNSVRFPSDVVDGMWVPGYIEYSVESSAIGIPIGLKFKLGNKPNHFFLSSSIQAQFILTSKDKLVFIESGHLSEFNPDSNGVIINRTPLLIGTGFGYDFSLCKNSRMSLEPFIDYSLKEIHRPRQNFLQAGGRPFFMGLRFAYYNRYNKRI